ncbi:hypothetical protein H5410_059510 [Solanum commersonii]|uniref:Uncharacterized protein n=1 Tax=Solanum commersonii TaxID=4109 RepID=A0A9J5W354_SOLCO|nr:hypothetical protein H5410_059510 [Solanum commersonii]
MFLPFLLVFVSCFHLMAYEISPTVLGMMVVDKNQSSLRTLSYPIDRRFSQLCKQFLDVLYIYALIIMLSGMSLMANREDC